MTLIGDLAQYTADNWGYILELTWDHILMVLVAVVLALIVGIPLGIISARFEKAAPVILNFANFVQITPSLALLAVMLLFFGLGFMAAVAALFLYSLLPIIRNTYVGLREVDPHLLEAGKGFGMTTLQLLTKVQLPLSFPFLMAGLRVASVIAVGVASIAPYVGADGLGELIIAGISTQNTVKIYAGAIPAALLAILADIFLGLTEKRAKQKTA
ncbi:MAG TPA: ABC transporter permease [Bacillales bacterium]|nr:ABC transporter permease [Bacillales bacterium]